MADSDGRPRPSVEAEAGEASLERVLREHHELMLRRARRISLCDDDAHDAVQSAVERYLIHQHRVDPETRTGWLVTVTRNEALRIRNGRLRASGPDPDEHQLPHHGETPLEQAEREETVELAREALAAIKPQERQALLLQAEGHSYDEIAEQLEWTRTKVNRNLTEGRAHLRDRLRGIAAGEGCAAAKPRIERLAHGAASADDLVALRPHLRRCSSCRAQLRRARGSAWVAAPPMLLAWLPWIGRLGQAPPGRVRVSALVADRIASLLPAGGVVGDAGVAVTAGIAATALAAGTIVVTTDGTVQRPRPATPSSQRAVADPGRLTAPSPPVYRTPIATAKRTGRTTAGSTSTAARPTNADAIAAGTTAEREFGPESGSTPPPSRRSTVTSRRSSNTTARQRESASSTGSPTRKTTNSRGSAAREFGIEP